ncbi:MAG: SirB2 family protein [Xanthomonadales bacterium]|nr:SirB2 family protein [Xanthomonadales bacterium]
METVKTIHIAFVTLSFAGFFVRGIWMLKDSKLLQQRWVKISPQIVDTVLLVSAIVLAVNLRVSPLEQAWLMAKIIALLLYIAAGLVALRFGRSRRIRLNAWLFGLVIYLYIVSVALSKSVTGWFAFI